MHVRKTPSAGTPWKEASSPFSSHANLLFVTGGSPQVVTETAFALSQRLSGNVDVHILTTRVGAEAIASRLLSRDGAWHALRRRWPAVRRFRLNTEHILLLRDSAGRPIDDVRSETDNAAVADQILSVVHSLTRPGMPPLHASLAGGRKTMGYMLATSLILCGRLEDRLYHVLLHPPELEGTDFFFPEPPPSRRKKIDDQRPDAPAALAPRSARVELAELPYPRLRALRAPELADLGSFSGLVATLQTELDAFLHPRVCISRARRAVICSGQMIRLSPVRFAIYEVLAERRLSGCLQSACPGCPACFIADTDIASQLRGVLRRRLSARDSAAIGRDWDAASFRSERSKINRAIRSALHSGAEPYKIGNVGPRGARLYGLTLPARAIGFAA